MISRYKPDDILVAFCYVATGYTSISCRRSGTNEDILMGTVGGANLGKDGKIEIIQIQPIIENNV